MAERLELAPLGSVGPTSRSYWVVEGRFAAGAYPGEAARSERPPEVVSDLLAAGIDTFVNLTEDDPSGPESFLNRYDDHVEGVAAVHRFPIVDVSIPSVGRMVEILDFLDATFAAGRNPYVHCWGGVGRTGTVVGCWLIRHGYAEAWNVRDELERLRAGDLGAGHRDSPQVIEQWDFVRAWEEGR